jgi:hypothetical protein
MMMKRYLFLSLFLLSGIFAVAQNQSNPTVNPPAKVVPKKKVPKQDGFVYREVSVTDTVVPYAKVCARRCGIYQARVAGNRPKGSWK